MHYRIGLLHPDLSTLSHAEPQTKLVSVLFFFLLVQAHWFGYVIVWGFRSGCHWFDFSVFFCEVWYAWFGEILDCGWYDRSGLR